MPNLRPEIGSVLGRLRRRIRRYVVIEGIALVLVVLGLLFWASLALDWFYFQASHLELPRWFRAAFGIAAIGLVAAGVLVWIGMRLLRSFRAKALALVLERRFPELNDRLITAVESADSPESVPPLTASMLNRTIEDVARMTRDLELGSVFDKAPLRRAVVLAAVLIVSILGFAATNADAMERWYNGFVDLEESYWRRETLLEVKVVAQPGDRIREFEDFRYKHARGADLTLLVEVPEGKVVPERVRIDYRIAGGRGRGRTRMSRVGDRQFQHTLPGLLDGVQLYVDGGDYTNPRPYVVEVVEPPRIDRIVLDSLYPAYTRLNDVDERRRPVRTPNAVQGTQISLPMETDFLFEADVNKPLVGGRLEGDLGSGRFELSFGTMLGEGVLADPSAPSAMLTLKGQDGEPELRAPLPQQIAARLLSSDGRHLSIPFVLTTDALKKLPLMLSAAQESSEPVAVPLPADALVRIYLEDVDGIISIDPARLTVNGIVDQPPVIETELRGISTSITRKARIPVTGVISDDYGLAGARFEFRVDNGEDWQQRPFARPPRGGQKEHRLARSAEEEFERFDVVPLDLSIGQKLTLTVSAVDGDDMNGPHSSQGQKYVFSIVSNEELLSHMYAKELNLRRRFEQILSEVKQTQQDLILHRTRSEEGRQLREADAQGNREQLDAIQIAVTASAERALHGVRKNATETAAIEESFGDIRAELVNNAVDTPQILERIDVRIVTPLHRINAIEYPEVDQGIALVKLASEEGADPIEQIDRSVEQLAAIIERMEQVLLEMRKLETFQEALELLKSIIAEEERLLEKTRTERRKGLIESLQ